MGEKLTAKVPSMVDRKWVALKLNELLKNENIISMSVVTLEELVNAGVYFGHQSNRWNPKMFPYIYTKKNGTHLIDLVQTACALIHVHDFVQKQAAENKNFLFIGTKRQATNIIVQEAEKCNSPYINHRWLGGTLTNWPTIQKRIEYLKE